MAKSWKNFVKKEDNPSTDPDSSKELSGIEKELNLSIEELAKSNEQLQSILQERNALEEKMRQLTGAAGKKEEANPRFGGEIGSITDKRREDRKRFENKQKLEEKIRLKKAELSEWNNKISRIKEKVNKVKEKLSGAKEKISRTKEKAIVVKEKVKEVEYRFARIKEEPVKKKKQIAEFERAIKSKIADKFDYEKIRGQQKKITDEFPFTEKIIKRTDDVFEKPAELIKEKITERAPVKKIIDNWELIREKKREAEQIKAKFEKLIDKKNEVVDFKDKFAKTDDVAVPEEVDDFFADKEDEPAKEKPKSSTRKKSLFERLNEGLSGRKSKKEKGFSTSDLDKIPGLGNSGEKDDEEKKKDEEDDIVKRDESRRQKREQRRVERKARREENEFKKAEQADAGNDDSENSESALRKKKKEEDEENEKREKLRLEKMEERRMQRREERRNEDREERPRKIKDKFN